MTHPTYPNLIGPHNFYVVDGRPDVTLWFDTEKHVYYREYADGSLIPQLGVTSIIRIIDKSLYLMPWAVKKMYEKLERTLPTCETFDGLVVPETPFVQIMDIVKEAKSAHKEILVDAGDVGTAAHKSLEKSIWFAIEKTGGVVTVLKDAPTDPRAVSCCDAAMKWMTAHNVRWLAKEKKTYSRQYEYAGTMDGLCFVDSCDNRVCCAETFFNRSAIMDWKSGNQLDVGYCLQLAAYRSAYLEEFPDKKITDGFILRLGKESGEFEPWHMDEADFDADFEGFLACLNLTRIHESAKVRMSEAKKARTARKRAAKED